MIVYNKTRKESKTLMDILFLKNHNNGRFIFVGFKMFLLVSIVLASSFFVDGKNHPTTSTLQKMQSNPVCCEDFHASPVKSIDHGMFNFSPLSVGFMERKRFDTQRMRSLENEIMEHPGQQSIRSRDGFYIAVTGVKNQIRHPGCFKDDDQCRVLDLVELTTPIQG